MPAAKANRLYDTDLHGFELGGVPQVVVALSLHAVFCEEEDLVSGGLLAGRHPRYEADLKHVVIVRREGELGLQGQTQTLLVFMLFSGQL